MWTNKESDSRILAMIVALAVGVTAITIVFLPAGAARQISTFLLLWIWPAMAWALILKGPVLERLLLGAGMALLLNALVGLLIGTIPGQISFWALFAGTLLVSFIPLVVVIWRPNKEGRWVNPNKKIVFAMAAVVLLALFLRLTNLGYKELQGDEGVIMVRAAAVIQGDGGEIHLHQKGPVEILLPMITWGLTERIDDFWARIPFTWAGLLGVIAVYALGRRWFTDKTGITAALFYAIGGFGIAFSRIIQYQSLVILWGALALLAASRYRDRGRSSDLWLTAVFLAGGLLAHYDAILIVPALLWVLYLAIRNQSNSKVWYWILAGFLGLAILLLFYLPFVLNPNFGRTFEYLLGDRVGAGDGGSSFGWGGASVWRMMTFYNSIWYVLGVAILVIVGIWRVAFRRKGFAALLYFAAPTLFYLFIVNDPRTHVYTIFPGAVILAAFGVLQLASALQSRGSRGISMTAGVLASIWLIVVLVYPILMFVDTSVERQRSWEKNRPLPWLYPTTWDGPPLYGLFGFPHQAGWRLGPDLIAAAGLPYGSNEEEEITNWYMAQAARTHCSDYNTFIVASQTQDAIPYDPDMLERNHLQGIVTVNGQDTMAIYGRDVVETIERYEANGKTRWLSAAEVAAPDYGGIFAVDVVLGGQVRLLGYDLDTSQAKPGGQLVVTLYWESLQPVNFNNQVFVHLYDGELRAQHDGGPECNINPTTRWEPGQIISDPHVVELPEDIPYGRYPLLVGMYDLLTKERLQVPGNPDDAIYLTDVTVETE